MDLNWHLTGALICISLKNNNIEHIFMFFLVICLLFCEKCLFKFFAHILVGLFGFLLLSRNSCFFFFLLHIAATAAAAKTLQSFPTLCYPIDHSPPGSLVPGILQARILEWGAISFSNAWKWKGKVKSLSRVWLLATPWTAAYQALPSMGFSRQEYWSGVPLPSPLLQLLDPYQRYDLLILSPISWVVPSVAWSCPLMYEIF